MCTSLTCHGTSAKAFSDSLGLPQSVNFLTRILINGTPSLLDLILTNFPDNICCSSSAPIGSSDHVLVQVDISLAIIREPPHCRRVWHFTQADWPGLQAAIKLIDWSPIATFSNINSSREFLQRNLLSLMHRFIPSRLQLSSPSSHPWFTEACGKAVVLKQLAFASWKANPTEVNLNSFYKAQNKCVSTLRRARKQHLSKLKSELSNLSPSSKSWGHRIKSVSGVCSPSIPSLSSNGCTADTAREKAECLNSVFAAKSCVQNPSLSVPTLPSHAQLSLDCVLFS